MPRQGVNPPLIVHTKFEITKNTTPFKKILNIENNNINFDIQLPPLPGAIWRRKELLIERSVFSSIVPK